MSAGIAGGPAAASTTGLVPWGLGHTFFLNTRYELSKAWRGSERKKTQILFDMSFQMYFLLCSYFDAGGTDPWMNREKSDAFDGYHR